MGCVFRGEPSKKEARRWTLGFLIVVVSSLQTQPFGWVSCCTGSEVHVVEAVVEVAWLVRSVEVAAFLVALGAGLTFAVVAVLAVKVTFAVVVALTTVVALSALSALAAFSAFRARTAFAFHVSLWFGDEYAV